MDSSLIRGLKWLKVWLTDLKKQKNKTHTHFILEQIKCHLKRFKKNYNLGDFLGKSEHLFRCNEDIT